jgi:hypothetical protein
MRLHLIELDDLMETFLTVFYVHDAYLASQDPSFLQRAIDLIVKPFARVGLETNVKKTQAMICTTPGRIRIQLPTASYYMLVCVGAGYRQPVGQVGRSNAFIAKSI